MDPTRINALANVLDAIQREQEADGFELFCIGSDDKINHNDAKEIVAALKAHATALSAA